LGFWYNSSMEFEKPYLIICNRLCNDSVIEDELVLGRNIGTSFDPRYEVLGSVKEAIQEHHLKSRSFEARTTGHMYYRVIRFDPEAGEEKILAMILGDTYRVYCYDPFKYSDKIVEG